MCVCVDFVKVAQKRKKSPFSPFLGGTEVRCRQQKKEEVDGPWKMIPFPMDEGRREIDPLIQQRVSEESRKTENQPFAGSKCQCFAAGQLPFAAVVYLGAFRTKGPLSKQGKEIPPFVSRRRRRRRRRRRACFCSQTVGRSPPHEKMMRGKGRSLALDLSRSIVVEVGSTKLDDAFLMKVCSCFCLSPSSL